MLGFKADQDTSLGHLLDLNRSANMVIDSEDDGYMLYKESKICIINRYTLHFSLTYLVVDPMYRIIGS